MSAVTFDTLKFTETLREAGIPETHAKAISIAVRGAHDTTEIATKTDLRETSSELRADMQTLRSGLRADMRELRAEVRTDMQELRTEVRSDIQRIDTKVDRLDAKVDRLELQLTVRLGGLVVIALGGFTALSKWIG